MIFFQFNVSVSDENDNIPYWTRIPSARKLQITENFFSSTQPIFNFEARDVDISDVIEYNIAESG